MKNWKGCGEKKDRREQSERRELEKGAGGKKRVLKSQLQSLGGSQPEGQVVS